MKSLKLENTEKPGIIRLVIFEQGAGYNSLSDIVEGELIDLQIWFAENGADVGFVYTSADPFSDSGCLSVWEAAEAALTREEGRTEMTHPNQIQRATYGNFAGYLIHTEKQNGVYSVFATPEGETLATIAMHNFPTFFSACKAMKKEILSFWKTR